MYSITRRVKSDKLKWTNEMTGYIIGQISGIINLVKTREVGGCQTLVLTPGKITNKHTF